MKPGDESVMLMLKKATPVDAPLLFLLRYKCFLPQYAVYGMKDDPCTDTEEKFLELVRAGGTYCILWGETCIGGLTMEQTDDYVTLKEIYVAEEYRAFGAAQKALLHAEVLMPSPKYFAQVISGDNETIRLLRGMGYKTLPEYTKKSDRVTLLNLQKDASSYVSVALEPLSREQLSKAVSWCNEDENRELYCPLWQNAREKVLTMTEFSKDFSLGKHFVGANQLNFVIKAVEFDRQIGIVSLSEIDWEQKTATVDRLILDPKWRNVRIGRRVLEQLCALAQGQYGITQLKLTVLEENQPAIACFLKSGFSESSRKQNIMRGGEDTVHTRIVMGRVLEDKNDSDA